MTTRNKKFYPVIHCISPYDHAGIRHAYDNISIAMNHGADGVMLIGHNIGHNDLLDIYDSMRKFFPDAWIGINFLDLPYPRMIGRLLYIVKEMNNVNALWMDTMPDKSITVPLGVQLFGGVAFKYHHANASGEALERACTQALSFVDVATTSGPETGVPASLDKVREIRAHLGNSFPLALASGVNADNVPDVLPYVDIFLVASSLLDEGGGIVGRKGDYFDPAKVRALADKIHGVN